ncbi:MAG: TonB-dependent receptor, partial [Bacteroidales bacterium]|nr:TonB-dependent receptor [Bacteroidales bacterium]
LFLMLFTFQISLKAQESLLLKKITIKCEQCTIEEVINDVTNQTKIKFAYSRSQINVNEKINVVLKDKELKTLLNILDEQYGIKFKLIGNTISLFPSAPKTKRSSKIVVSGYVEDKHTGERLIGANIYFPGSYEGTVSNDYGFFSIPIGVKATSIVCSFVGYQNIIVPSDFQRDTLIRIELSSSIEMEEVVVRATNNEVLDKNMPIGMIRIPMAKIELTPVILGETDVLKVAQLLPGVSEGSEGNSGLYIRGGSADQNLILLDGITVFNPNHLFGFFSVFNADAIKDFRIIKGGFPARYGGRISSVVDLKMKEGNIKKLSGGISLGLISSKAYIEGPLIKDRTSFFISARRTYIDLLAGNLVSNFTDFDESNYYFYDVNAKLNHKFSDKHRLYLSYYLGRDNGDSEDKNDANDAKLKTEEISNLSWGNSIYGLRWNWLMSSNLFLNTTVAYSSYDYLNEEIFKNQYIVDDDWTNKEYSTNVESGINILSSGLDFNWIPSTKHHVRFGLKYFYHNFNTGMESRKYISADDENEQVNEEELIYANEGNIFIEDEIQLNPRLSTNIGLHYSMFFVNNESYKSLEPRLSLKYDLSDKIQLNAGGAIMQQYTQMLSFSRITLSSDLWVPVTENIVPAKSQQASIGTSWDINKAWSCSIEGYYKNMTNLLEYSESASFFEGESWQERVEQGDGKSYGVEFLIERSQGKLTGWIAYTLAESTRQFDNINDGKIFPYKYDKRHDLNIVVDYKLLKHLSVNAVWTYKTGNAETLGVIKYPSQLGFSSTNTTNHDDIVYQKRNDYRMPAYHRLDISINWQKQKEKLSHLVSLGIYNAYNRDNPYKISLFDASVYSAQSGGYIDTKVIKEKSLFGILPSITYTIKF